MFKPTCLILIIIIALWLAPCLAQPIIRAIAPNSGYQGEVIYNVIITGQRTHFHTNFSDVDFGAGIRLEAFKVDHSEQIVAHIKIESDAALGSRTVRIHTGSESVALENGFEVLKSGEGVNVRLDVIPVETLYLADFDPHNLTSAPLLFTIMLYNDDQLRTCTLEMTISGERYGPILTATKTLNEFSAFAIKAFSNRDFDDYNVSGAGNDVINIITQTGKLPADNYSYSIRVLDEKGHELAKDIRENEITNLQNEIELIGPGRPVHERPEIVTTPNPLFQWFSQAAMYRFTLYPVHAGQTTAEEILRNRPVYEQNSIMTFSLLYPNFAEILMEGQTYAWQIQAQFSQSGSESVNISEIFWFSLGSPDPNTIRISKIEITPFYLELWTNQTCQFSATIIDENNEIIDLKPEWQVIPPGFGEVDENGYFIAGKREKTVVVMARYGEIYDYASINIKWDKATIFDFQSFFLKLFGLE